MTAALFSPSPQISPCPFTPPLIPTFSFVKDFLAEKHHLYDDIIKEVMVQRRLKLFPVCILSQKNKKETYTIVNTLPIRGVSTKISKIYREYMITVCVHGYKKYSINIEQGRITNII